MCKACKMDPSEIAKYRLRQGAVPIEDFDDEVPTRHPKRRKPKKEKYPRQFKPGCPGNDNGPHVYVWTTEGQEPTLFSDYFGFHRRKHEVCAGCLTRRRSALSDEYMKVKERKWAKLNEPVKGEPVSRGYRSRRGLISFSYWDWENEDEEYRAKRKEYLQRRGWTTYLYDW